MEHIRTKRSSRTHGAKSKLEQTEQIQQKEQT